MCRISRQSMPLKQQGSALVIAIFIIVVILLLGTALVRMLSSSSNTTAYEVVGTRAYNAANSGLQKRLSELFPLNPSPLNPIEVCSTIGTDIDDYLFFTNHQGLVNCRVSNMKCNDFTQDGVRYYRLISTGQCDIGNGEVTSRTIEVEARSL